MSFICLKVKIDFYMKDVTLTLFLRKRQKVNAEVPFLETNTRKLSAEIPTVTVPTYIPE